MAPSAPPPGIDQRLATWPSAARSRLEELGPASRHTGAVLFSAAATQRLFEEVDAAPEHRSAYSATWRPVLAATWAWAAGDPAGHPAVRRALAEFYLSPYSAEDGPDDIDQDEAAAAYFTASCVVHGLLDFALLATARTTDAIDTRWYGHDENQRQTALAAELDRQAADLALVCDWAAGSPPGGRAPTELIGALRRP